MPESLELGSFPRLVLLSSSVVPRCLAQGAKHQVRVDRFVPYAL